MFSKIFDKKTKAASQILKLLNITGKRAQYLTQFKDIQRLFNSQILKIPTVHSFLKAMKKQSFSLDYIIKCGVLAHYFLQKCTKDQIISLRDFISHLTFRLRQIGQSMGCILQTEVLKIHMTSLATQSNETNHGKEIYILKEIIRPYFCYLSKKTLVKEQTLQEETLQAHQIWRLVNLLKLISSITSKFMLIGRYYFQDYAAIVILLSEILSIDIFKYVTQINKYMRFQSRTLCLSSERVQDKREVDDFLRLLQEMGWLKEKLAHFFLGKYFYQFLSHIKQPQWLDSNSQQFDSIFFYRK